MSSLMSSVGQSRKIFVYLDEQPTIKNDGTVQQQVKVNIVFSIEIESMLTRESCASRASTLHTRVGRTIPS